MLAISSPRPLLEVDRVTLRYETPTQKVVAAKNVTFQVYPSDRFVLLGPSGCGKSTLLKAIGGFMPPSDGEIRLDGVRVREPGPDRMFVFQEFDQLLPWMTVSENLRFALANCGRRISRKEACEISDRYLDKVKLWKFRDAYPHTLSGGMKQRAAIARGLAMQPAILLMDEPFAALDALTRRQMQDELLELWEETKFTVIFVTHSIDEGVILGSRILILSPHPGRVRAEINTHEMDRSQANAPKVAATRDRIYRMLFDRAPDMAEAH
ncbi:ABC transporter ATP-binding protein [Bradyrhizobium sp. SYSU BS000235]|uniref:ABC transporter ATP-binding protein n=1 Tax=Bradyrhizobium sp. SYSU BS000235 TaxID=3411332 RepID=UPI003C76A335